MKEKRKIGLQDIQRRLKGYLDFIAIFSLVTGMIGAVILGFLLAAHYVMYISELVYQAAGDWGITALIILGLGGTMTMIIIFTEGGRE